MLIFILKHINVPIIKKILNLGLPSGFQYFFEIGAFSFAIIMIGWLGAKQLAAHQIAINLASISYMAVLGISTAGGIRVGNAVGRQNTAEIRRAGFTALLSGSFIMITSGVIFITMRNILPTLYISDDKVIHIASSLLIIAALFQFLMVFKQWAWEYYEAYRCKNSNYYYFYFLLANWTANRLFFGI